MKVKQSVLEASVKNLLKVISAKPSLPILNDILIVVNGEGASARLMASDNEAWVAYAILLESASHTFSLCVNAKTLYEMIANVSDQVLTFTYDDSTMKLTMEYGTGSSYCMTDDPGTYPLPAISEEKVCTAVTDASTINRVIRRSAFATAHEDLRPALCGIDFEFSYDVMKVVATNGLQMMACKSVLTGTNSESFSFIMPANVANMLPSMLTTGDEDVDISYDGRNCCIVSGDAVIRFICVDATYPNWEKIIPTEFAHEVKFNRKGLINALRCVCPFSQGIHSLVKMEYSARSLAISADNVDFGKGAEVSIGIDGYEGEPMAIGMNAVNLITILSKLPLDDVMLKFNSPDKAMVVEPVGASDVLGELITALIMPMMLNS